MAEKLATRVEKLTGLLEVSKAMASERNLDTLLRLIAHEVTKVMEAERSSIFVVDREKQELWSRVAEGLDVWEIRVKLGTGIAGAVAQTGIILNIPDAYADPRFVPETDRRTGFRTRNVLCTPMLNKFNEAIGVIQVLNKEGNFTREDEELLLAFCGQAAAALENTLLYEEIQSLFEGFITASVFAIESRDPTTSGHSERIAVLMVAFAEQINRTEIGPHASAFFSLAEIREIRYAALLHDFGKLALDAALLVKANKLTDADLDALSHRFKFIRRTIENDFLKRKVAVAVAQGPNADFSKLDHDLQQGLTDLEEKFRFVQEANQPGSLAKGMVEQILEIADGTYQDVDGTHQPYLTSKEVGNLSIPKGSLNPEERLEIESHVTNTYRFLRRIPWIQGLRGIPGIAYAHHERVDGSGYPRGLQDDDIPLPSKMMAICDIYDSLTASDRPYKRAVAPELALDVLQSEANAGRLDPELVRIFCESKIWALSLSLRPQR